MSNNQVVIETLIAKRNQLKIDQDKSWHQYQMQIDEIEDALDKLEGKNVWRSEKREFYDDQNPAYITGSEDGI